MQSANGRVRLNQAMLSLHPDQVLYCDTDSLIYSGGPEIESGEGLGQLKLEGHYAKAAFVLPKVYCLTKRNGDSTYVAKGVPRDKAESFILNGFADFDAPIRLRESMRTGKQANVWSTKTRTIQSRYDKRKVRPDGTTTPLIIKQGVQK